MSVLIDGLKEIVRKLEEREKLDDAINAAFCKKMDALKEYTNQVLSKQ